VNGRGQIGTAPFGRCPMKKLKLTALWDGNRLKPAQTTMYAHTPRIGMTAIIRHIWLKLTSVATLNRISPELKFGTMMVPQLKPLSAQATSSAGCG